MDNSSGPLGLSWVNTSQVGGISGGPNWTNPTPGAGSGGGEVGRPPEDSFKSMMSYLNIYLTPIIVVVGITTNVLSLLVFTVTNLRLQSSR